MVVGEEAVKAVKSTEEFAQITKVVLSRMDDVKAALRASKAFGVTEKVAVFLADETASVGLNPRGLGKLPAAKQVVSLKQVKTLLSNKYEGKWSPGTYGDAAKNFKIGHYDKHVVERLEWNEVITPEAYRQKAIDLIKRRDAGVEIYYQPRQNNMAIYDRANNEFVVGNVNGEIQTLYRPRPLIDENGMEINYVYHLVNKGAAIKIEG